MEEKITMCMFFRWSYWSLWGISFCFRWIDVVIGLSMSVFELWKLFFYVFSDLTSVSCQAGMMTPWIVPAHLRECEYHTEVNAYVIHPILKGEEFPVWITLLCNQKKMFLIHNITEKSAHSFPNRELSDWFPLVDCWLEHLGCFRQRPVSMFMQCIDPADTAISPFI